LLGQANLRPKLILELIGLGSMLCAPIPHSLRSESLIFGPTMPHPMWRAMTQNWRVVSVRAGIARRLHQPLDLSLLTSTGWNRLFGTAQRL
jgi:hypothetical protein